MSVAIRTAVRLQDQDDVNVTLGAGVDEYALCWDNDTAKFVLRQVAGVYLLATGATTGATAQAQAFTVGVTVGSVATPATLLQVAETSTSSPRGIMSSQHSTGVDGARFHMRKSRGTNASPTVITTGDVLGRLVASGYDGSNYLEMGGIDIVSAGTIASTRVPTEIRFLTATDAAPSVLTQRMVIDKAGNVGIGTASPLTALHVASATTTTFSSIITTDSTGTHGLGFFGGYSGGTPLHPTLAWSAGEDLRLGGGTTNFGTGAGYSTYMTIKNAGLVGIGTAAPGTLLHTNLVSAATNAVTNVVTIGHDTSGTAAAGFGAGLLFQLESSTTAAQDAARIAALWTDATHATRKADLVLTAYDTVEREGLRIRGNGSAPAIGFLGATPQARIAHVADPAGGATVDAEARSAINSILSTLELFGLHAAS